MTSSPSPPPSNQRLTRTLSDRAPSLLVIRSLSRYIFQVLQLLNSQGWRERGGGRLAPSLGEVSSPDLGVELGEAESDPFSRCFCSNYAAFNLFYSAALRGEVREVSWTEWWWRTGISEGTRRCWTNIDLPRPILIPDPNPNPSSHHLCTLQVLTQKLGRSKAALQETLLRLSRSNLQKAGQVQHHLCLHRSLRFHLRCCLHCNLC